MIIRKIEVNPFQIPNRSLTQVVRNKLKWYIDYQMLSPSKELSNIEKYIKKNYNADLNLKDLIKELIVNINVIKGEDGYYIDLTNYVMSDEGIKELSTGTLYKILRYGSMKLRKTNLFENALKFALMSL